MSTGRRGVRATLALALVLVALASPAATLAQSPPAEGDSVATNIPEGEAAPALEVPPGPATPSDDPLSIAHLFPLRPEDQVRRAREEARTALAGAEGLLGRAKARVAEASSREEVAKQALAGARTRVKSARKAKDEASLPELERFEKRTDLELALADRLHDVAGAEVARARALQAAATASVRACELELDVTRRRASEPGVVAREVEVLALKAMKARAERLAERDKAEADLAEQWLRAYEAHRQLSGR